MLAETAGVSCCGVKLAKLFGDWNWLGGIAEFDHPGLLLNDSDGNIDAPRGGASSAHILGTGLEEAGLLTWTARASSSTSGTRNTPLLGGRLVFPAFG